MGNKHWANTWTEVEDLGGGKFAAGIHVGHKVFKDKTDGLYKKHKLTDKRPGKDYIVVQSAKVCIEIHAYYSKFYDVNYEEIRLHEERWVVQRLFKAPDEWRDVGAYNPVISVEEVSDAVKVTITYDTDYGELTVEYIQRDGNALKHNVTFKNTSGGEETFRVLQKWAGIVADRINGEEIITQVEKLKYNFRFEKAGKLQLRENLDTFKPTQVETIKKMWIRHGECNKCGRCCVNCRDYVEEYPHCKIYETRPVACREFPWRPEHIENIPECSYSFEATGIISPTKLQPTIIDKHPQGLKADFVYGDWILAQDESLEIDPDSVTLDDPTEDGYVWESKGNYYRDTSDTVIFFGEDLGLDPNRGYVEWNIESISDGATITKVEFRYHGRTSTKINVFIYAMADQPSVQSDDNAGNLIIFDDAGDGTAYLFENKIFPEPGTGKDIGGASGPAWNTSPVSDLQSQLASDWFAFGFKSDDDGYTFELYAEEYAATPDPTLYVEYTVPPIALNSVAAISVSTTSALSRGITEELTSTSVIASSITGRLTRIINLTSAPAIVTSITSILSRGIIGVLTSTLAITSSITSSLSRGVTGALSSTSIITSSITGRLTRIIDLVSTSTIVTSITSILSRGITQALTSTANGAVSITGNLSRGVKELLTSTVAVTTSITATLGRGITEALVSTASIVTSILGRLSRISPLTSMANIAVSITGILSRGITAGLNSTSNIAVSITSSLSRGITEALTSTANIVVSMLGRLKYDWWEEINPTIDWIEEEKAAISWDEETKSTID